MLAGLFKRDRNPVPVGIKPDNAPTWHPDVRFYRIVSAPGDLERWSAVLHVDPYARDTKRGGAWMVDPPSAAANEGRYPDGRLPELG